MKRPFLYFLIITLVGIYFFYQINLKGIDFLVLGLIILFTVVIFRYFIKYNTSILFIIAFFAIGGLLVVDSSTDSILIDLKKEYVDLKGIIKEEVKISKNYSKYILEATNIKYKNKELKLQENCMLQVSGKKVLRTGDKISLRGIIKEPNSNTNPGLFNYSLYLNTKSISVIVSTKSYLVKVISKENLSFGQAFVNNAKNKLVKTFNMYLSEKNSNLVKSMILGDSKYLENSEAKKIRDLGLAHLLAVSGLHIGILSMFIIFVLKLFRITPKVLIITTVIILWTYGYIVGYPSSILRALVMFSCLLLSKITFRRYDPINSLGFGGLLLLIYRPLWVFDIGFQLSFSATLSLLIFTIRIKHLFLHKIGKLGDILSPLIAVQLGIIPILAYHFNNVSFVSVFTNLILVPIMSIVVILAFVLIIVSFASAKLSIVIGMFLNTLLNISDYFITFIYNKLPIVTVEVFSPSLVEIILYFTLIFISLKIIDIKLFSVALNKVIVIYLTTLVMLSGVFFTYNDEVIIDFIDVGQGDATLIRDNSKAFLIDTGGSLFQGADVGNNTIIPFLLKEGITRLDAVFITHYHKDHCKALLSIIDKINVDKIIIGYKNKKSTLYWDIVKKAEEKNIPIFIVKRGDKIVISKNIKLFVLWPDKIKENKLYEYNENNMSLVLLLQSFDKKILFTGDIEKQSENKLANMNKECDVDIIKVPHHGSSTSSTEEFIKYFEPEVGVISVGNNNFGHPDNQVIKRYEENNVKIYRTDVQGLITVKLYPNSFEICPFVEDKLYLKEIIYINRIELLYLFCYIVMGLILANKYKKYFYTEIKHITK
ncbi:DNA internalization-related competence protein ComEC/Rec2 [Caldisalinibacter kiritimatiensis]|uniref:Late competence protein ComEC, DNA transport n=1 Tax=Caldisalinibacter kiritimatiensis TaxID=1304284 RepID=R1CKN5_9FIRM|nr:DNA internalization-related competence protein ComEC/Rec2 [Caldisalinibacter kiritimatiensis]EOC99285.1 Late competence protein ComEC, DNA transport [Caldisalinibacter kiritimatiensis]